MSSFVSEEVKGEICAMYRQAAFKKTQVKIIAELYLITRNRVCEILIERGQQDSVIMEMYNPSASKSKGARQWTPCDEERLLALKAEGKTYQQIADIMGRSFASVSARVYKLCNKDI